MPMERGFSIPVLDKGYVQYVMSCGEDRDIIRAARQSTGGGFVSWEPYDKHPNGDAGLLDYLWRNKHATPFEMSDLTIAVRAPLMVFREWHRSRTQSYNEFSARYSEMPNEHYVPEPDRIQKQSTTNKQGSGEAFTLAEATSIVHDIDLEQQGVYNQYEGMLQKGIAKEVARINTPVSRYSTMWAKANLRNWFQFLNLRMRPNAQLEIRQYANAVSSIIKELWPRAYDRFEEHDLYAVTFSRSQMQELQKLMLQPAGSTPTPSPELSGSERIEFLKKLRLGGKEIL